MVAMKTNTKSQGLVPTHFALIIIIVVHVYNYNYCKTSISINKINKYMQKAGESENDAGFLCIIIDIAS